MNIPNHPPRVLALLQQLEREQIDIIQLGSRVVMADDGAFFPLDFLVMGTLKRFASTSAAFRQLITAWNLTAARSLLRIHIDTGVRFSATWLTSDPHRFASKVLGGEQINRLKSRDGKKLTDAYLINMRSSEFPWLPAVYQNLSGFVHFSGSHISASVGSISSENQIVTFEIGEQDTRYPEFSWTEVIEYFSMATGILSQYLKGYGATKVLFSKSSPPGISVKGTEAFRESTDF